MDKYVNTDVGIYHIESVCEERASDGHKLYCVRCNICQKVYIRKLDEIKKCKQCRHLYAHWKYRRLGRIFNSMMSRCYNPNDKDFRWYGAKGVKVCQMWVDMPESFEEWALKNGYDDNLSIDRTDSNKNYCPDNCQWIPLKENARKAGKVNWITANGITLTGKQWAEKLNIGINTINRIIKKYGEDTTEKLISAMLHEPITTKNIKQGQSLLKTYNIQE